MNVFTYGTLMFDEVWSQVVGRLGKSTAGTLEGFRALKIANEVFPGMIPAIDGWVNGRIWLGVEPDELASLDRYESELYERQVVEVRPTDAVPVTCWTYVVRSEFRNRLLAEVWDPEEFREQHLAGFMKP